MTSPIARWNRTAVCGQLVVNEFNDQIKPDCGQAFLNESTNNNHSTLLETDVRLVYVLVGTTPTVFIALNNDHK